MERLQIEESLFSCIQRLIESDEGRCGMILSRGELLLLWYIHRSNNLAMPGELSREMHVSTARIARILNTLETRGFIQRSIDPEDRRRIIVVLTQKGQSHLEAIHDRMHARISAIVEALGEEDTKEFLRLADRIITISSELSQAEKNDPCA